MSESQIYHEVEDYIRDKDIRSADIMDFSQPFQRVVWSKSPPSVLKGNSPSSIDLPPGEGVWTYHVTDEPVFWVWRLWKDYGREPENAYLLEFDSRPGDAFMEDFQQIGAASPSGYAPGAEPPKEKNYDDMWEFGEDLIDWTVDMHRGPKEDDAPDPEQYESSEMFLYDVKNWSDGAIANSFDNMFPEDRLGDSGIVLTTRETVEFSIKGKFDVESRSWK